MLLTSFLLCLIFTKMSEQELPEVKVNKSNTSAVKNALDAAVKNVFIKHYGYTEDFKINDRRLFISTIAVLLAGVAILSDYLYPFPESKKILTFCVVVYFILIGILELYNRYIKKDIFCVMKCGVKGELDPDVQWKCSSSLKKVDHNYHLTMSRHDSEVTNVISISAFTSFRYVIDIIDTNPFSLEDLVDNVFNKILDGTSASHISNSLW
nr:EOG090X0FS4 [Artemia franciscana]